MRAPCASGSSGPPEGVSSCGDRTTPIIEDVCAARAAAIAARGGRRRSRKVKTEMLQLQLMETKRELVRRADVDALIDGIAGVTLTALSSYLRGAHRLEILRSGAA